MNTTEKLIKALNEAGYNIPGDTSKWSIRRTYAGHIQRSNGAFSFFLEWNGSKDDEAYQYSNLYGSQYPATMIIKRGVDEVVNRYGDLHIYPKGYENV